MGRSRIHCVGNLFHWNSSMYLCPFKLLNFRNCCIYSFIQETQKFVFKVNLNGLVGFKKLRSYPLCRWHFGHRWLSFHAKLCSHWSKANAIRKAISLESWLICNLFTKWSRFQHWNIWSDIAFTFTLSQCVHILITTVQVTVFGVV